MSKQEKRIAQVWEIFAERENLSGEQVALYQRYAQLLLEYNEKFNLTAIRDIEEVVRLHFRDSLALRGYIDPQNLSIIADVGTGAGFPGLALKILYPDLGLILLEVNKKKQKFLRMVADELNLSDVEIFDNDWRTFLRTTEGSIDLFCARASLDPKELIRMFKPGCSYKESKLVYWASKAWEADKKISSYITDEYRYKLGMRERRLIVLEKPE